MAYLQHALELFQFKSMDDVSTESLKRAFKKQVLTSHPDKGGSEAEFDRLLSSYLYLCETIQRLSGGRTTLQNVNAPDEIRESRANQLINEIFEEFERDHFDAFVAAESAPADSNERKYSRVKVTDAFHEEFEKVHVKEKGYSEWLSATDDADTLAYSEQGLYKDITIKAAILTEKDLNCVFEAKMAEKPAREETSLALHPDEMAYESGSTGLILIDEGKGYSSAPGTNPMFCDVYAAFTSENTVLDKVQPITLENKPKTLDELIAERERVYEFYKDDELEAIAAYEQRRFEEEKRHKNSIKNYFSGSMKVIESDEVKEDCGFCIQIGK